MINIRLALISAVLAVAPYATAETIILEEDFNADYSKSFPYTFDGDGLTPHPDIASLFYSNALGTYAPWWIVRDSNTSEDRFMGSHSYYETADTSNDWLISKPLDIVSTGFILEFDAQSVNVRGEEYLSDLAIFITEDMLDPQDPPTTPTHVFSKIPWGANPDNCEGDWTHYTYNLDDYVGKTIYISFVNKNTDKDIVCIDNVKVYRHDVAEIALNDFEAYTTDTSAKVGITIVVTEEGGVGQWILDLICNGDTIKTWQGESLAQGATETFETDLALTVGDATDFEFVFTTDGSKQLNIGGTITCLAFNPVHRVFMEETTSLHCGNCPMGIYAVESLLEDPDLGEYVLPVSVHIANLGFDPMSVPEYFTHLPEYNSAPLVFVDRNSEYDGFVPTIECNYDPTNPYSFAYRIAQRVAQGTSIDVAVEADWVVQGTDTVAIECTAKVIPAFNIKGKNYRVAFVLTENNVGLDKNRYWLQENYLSGKDYASRFGGWCDLPERVVSARYHEVARAISSYHGHINSLPSDMNCNEEYTFTYSMPIPNTEQDSNGYHLSDAIHTMMCEVTAIVIDHETGLVLNAARVPMSELATKRFTAKDLLEVLNGVNDIISDADDNESAAVYYDITGRRINEPQGGVYIRRTPTGVTKVIK